MLAALAAMAIAGSPFVCNLRALSPAEREAHGQLSQNLRKAALERRELADGFAVRIEPRELSAADLGRWIEAEHRCCPFLRLEIVQEPEPGPLWLRLLGPTGVKDFLLAEFGS